MNFNGDFLCRNRDLADIPNQEGYKFIGINHDDVEGECYVAKDALGMHTVKGAFTWFDLKSWRTK